MCDNIIHINIPIPDILSDITKYTRSCYAKEGDIKKFNSNFLIEFNELLQNELQNNLNCYLINGNGYNKFKKENSLKMVSDDWNGIYVCKEKTCNNRFK